MKTSGIEKKSLSYLAMANMVAVLTALLIAKAADHSFDRAALVWLVGCITTGMIGSNNYPISLLKSIKFSTLTAGLLCIALVVYFYLQWLISNILNFGSNEILISFYGGLINVADPKMFPIVVHNEPKERIVNALEAKGIETRDMVPLVNQPIYKKLFNIDAGEYPVSKWICENGFYIGCHQDLNQEDLDYIIEVFAEVLADS